MSESAIQNLCFNTSIILKKRDVRILSAKGCPGIIEHNHYRCRPKTSSPEDAFAKGIQHGTFKMKLGGHKKYLHEICEKVDQDLNSPTCRRLRVHLSSCPFCSAYYDSLKETILLYKEYDVKLKGSRVKSIIARLR